MSYYIIIRGPAGIGKSAIAKKLAQQLQTHHISFDHIRIRYHLGIQEQDRIKANEIAIPEAKEKLDGGHRVVFEGVFYHKSQLQHLIKNLAYRHFVFSLHAPLQECIGRDSSREGEARIGEERVREVYERVARFDYGMVIDTSGKTVAEVVQEIRSHLPKS